MHFHSKQRILQIAWLDASIAIQPLLPQIRKHATSSNLPRSSRVVDVGQGESFWTSAILLLQPFVHPLLESRSSSAHVAQLRTSTFWIKEQAADAEISCGNKAAESKER